MTRIGSIQTNAARDFSPIKMEVKQCYRPIECSDKIASAKKSKATCGNLWIILLKPFTMLGWLITAIGSRIRNWILPCCKYAPAAEKLKWTRIRSMFDGIYQNVVTSRDSIEERQNKFDEIMQKLPNMATKEFKKHIGYVQASKEKEIGDDRAKQERWYEKNKSTIEFEEYFKVNNSILKEAVINFNKKLREKS